MHVGGEIPPPSLVPSAEDMYASPLLHRNPEGWVQSSFSISLRVHRHTVPSRHLGAPRHLHGPADPTQVLG